MQTTDMSLVYLHIRHLHYENKENSRRTEIATTNDKNKKKKRISNKNVLVYYHDMTDCKRNKNGQNNTKKRKQNKKATKNKYQKTKRNKLSKRRKNYCETIMCTANRVRIDAGIKIHTCIHVVHIDVGWVGNLAHRPRDIE